MEKGFSRFIERDYNIFLSNLRNIVRKGSKYQQFPVLMLIT